MSLTPPFSLPQPLAFFSLSKPPPATPPLLCSKPPLTDSLHLLRHIRTCKPEELRQRPHPGVQKARERGCIPSGWMTCAMLALILRSSMWRLRSSAMAFIAATPSTKLKAMVGPHGVKGDTVLHQARDACSNPAHIVRLRQSAHFLPFSILSPRERYLRMRERA